MSLLVPNALTSGNGYLTGTATLAYQTVRATAAAGSVNYAAAPTVKTTRPMTVLTQMKLMSDFAREIENAYR
jgi:hypothetical protein